MLDWWPLYFWLVVFDLFVSIVLEIFFNSSSYCLGDCTLNLARCILSPSHSFFFIDILLPSIFILLEWNSMLLSCGFQLVTIRSMVVVIMVVFSLVLQYESGCQ